MGVFPGRVSDLELGTPVATLLGTWRYQVSAGTGWPVVSKLWLGEVESLIWNFYVSVAAGKFVWADRSLRCFKPVHQWGMLLWSFHLCVLLTPSRGRPRLSAGMSDCQGQSVHTRLQTTTCFVKSCQCGSHTKGVFTTVLFSHDTTAKVGDKYLQHDTASEQDVTENNVHVTEAQWLYAIMALLACVEKIRLQYFNF